MLANLVSGFFRADTSSSGRARSGASPAYPVIDGYSVFPRHFGHRSQDNAAATPALMRAGIFGLLGRFFFV